MGFRCVSSGVGPAVLQGTHLVLGLPGADAVALFVSVGHVFAPVGGCAWYRAAGVSPPTASAGKGGRSMAAALDFVVMAPSVAHGATGLGPLQARIGLAPPPFERKLRFYLLEAFVRGLVARDMAVAVGRWVGAPVAAGRGIGSVAEQRAVVRLVVAVGLLAGVGVWGMALHGRAFEASRECRMER